ncbi:hypothetical protein Q0812_10775 [Brevundimonas sp. 2R-24]|uniref:Uncharacterized protein n=1 Tax=Peiella sedimenti TaxID=3061083 RepID=A0ABT8SMV8_9CAUL|nr:hypothetical protein [Caulobacteraceae bacterium XZ-24]
MSSPDDGRGGKTVLIGGALAAVAVAVVAGVLLTRGGGEEKKAEPLPPSGLQLDVAEAPTLDPDRELRCFVDGQFVGMATLSVCAERNGVAAQALDVGLDESGALVAAPTASLAPPPELPPLVEEPEPKPVETSQPEPAPQPAPSGSACLRFNGSSWTQLSPNMSLNACVQALFAGECQRPGGASYGRWGEVTLRLVPRRVEQSFDNRRFVTLVEQTRNCGIPEIR